MSTGLPEHGTSQTSSGTASISATAPRSPDVGKRSQTDRSNFTGGRRAPSNVATTMAPRGPDRAPGRWWHQRLIAESDDHGVVTVAVGGGDPGREREGLTFLPPVSLHDRAPGENRSVEPGDAMPGSADVDRADHDVHALKPPQLRPGPSVPPPFVLETVRGACVSPPRTGSLRRPLTPPLRSSSPHRTDCQGPDRPICRRRVYPAPRRWRPFNSSLNAASPIASESHNP